MLNKIKCLSNIAIAAVVAGGIAPAALGAAQEAYPNKPLRLIVGFPPGGNANAAARLVAMHMSKAMDATIVVENRSGAGGSIAAQIASRANADGYTLLWSSPGALIINRIIERDVSYDADKAFDPVGQAFTFCNALIVRGDSPLTTVAQLLARAKAQPGQLQNGTQGVGSAGHLSAQMLQNLAGISLGHIPYKGGSEVITAILGGEAPTAFSSTLAAANVRSRLRVLAVTCARRDPSLPDVPTLQEAGVKGYDASFWFGMMVPAGTPGAIVQRLNKELRSALTDAEITRVAIKQGLIPAPSSAREFDAVIKADYVRWKKIIGKP